MARMQNGRSGPDMSSRALLPCVEMKCSAQDSVELEQVISSLDAGYTFEDSQDAIEPLWYKDVFLIDEEGNTVIEIPAHLHHVLLGPRAKVFMARPARETISTDDDKSNVCADCGASMTLTGSLANTVGPMLLKRLS
jgi:hypothetical protein